MLVITLDKVINDYELEKIGEMYKKQVGEGVVVLPKGATIERIPSIEASILIAEPLKPLTWREKLFGRNLLEAEEVKFIDKNNPVNPKPPGN